MRLKLPGSIYAVLVLFLCDLGRIVAACTDLQGAHECGKRQCFVRNGCLPQWIALQTGKRSSSFFFNSQLPHKRSYLENNIISERSPVADSDDIQQPRLEDNSKWYDLFGLHKGQIGNDNGRPDVDVLLVALIPVSKVQMPSENLENPIYKYLQMADKNKLDHADLDTDVDWYKK